MTNLAESGKKHISFPLRDITAECRAIDRVVERAVKAARKAEYLEEQ
jgi:hypothetical protein